MAARRRLLERSWAQAVLAWFAATLIRFITGTTRWRRELPESVQRLFADERPVIFCFWHGRLLLMRAAWQGPRSRFHMLISGHRDASIITGAMRRLGHRVITGSGSTPTRGGARALEEMQEVLAGGGALGVTPDGPKGPLMRVKGGAILAAQATGVPLVPVSGSVKRARLLSTWDRFCFAAPFNRGLILFGEPITVPAEAKLAEIEAARRQLEEALLSLTAEADGRFGRTTPEPASDPGRRPKSRKKKKKPQDARS